MLFAERDGTQAASQIKAFEDTWRWDEGAARAFQEVVEQGGRVSQAMQAFRTFLGDTDMLAYLAMMAPRLVELRRVLKNTGSLYLHCEIVFSVKAGKLHATYVRDLHGVVEREKAAIGVLLALDEPTRAMRREAASAGFYASPWGKHQRLQIITIEDLLTGKNVDRPPIQASVTFKRAPKTESRPAERQETLGIGGDEPVF